MISSMKRRGIALALAVAAGLPAAPAVADPAPPAPDPAGSAAVSEADVLAPGMTQLWPLPGAQRLVPGLPQKPAVPDTPDQALPPQVYRPSAAEEAVEPVAPAPAAEAPVEYVPATEAARAPACTASTGPYQKQVERWLKLKADGRQSPADCRAIKAFQQKQGIRPAIGFAGPVTYARVRQLHAAKYPESLCPKRKGRVACVDLRRQLMWVTKGGKRVFGPVPIRTGRPGYATRTGWHKIYWRHKNHYSTLYEAPMPYSQFFSGGQAFHGIYGSVYRPPGSHGCVNMTFGDAKKLWAVLRSGDQVYVWGQKPRG
ncbi:L,D-transpeptidase family protein [Streptomyces indicus]|uniref:L,D-transpeptidase catalytic domain n=1 Tax=Streptomyces indicus TaxID=417292 RepID=A0A1G9E0A3_9ACTN|nr:L,D-transpeptidase family protein [Streptomyces indicus]SDK69533.1 L,D-transpeptidase catalytic domain [Streptomyces indicus]